MSSVHCLSHTVKKYEIKSHSWICRSKDVPVWVFVSSSSRFLNQYTVQISSYTYQKKVSFFNSVVSWNLCSPVTLIDNYGSLQLFQCIFLCGFSLLTWKATFIQANHIISLQRTSIFLQCWNLLFTAGFAANLVQIQWILSAYSINNAKIKNPNIENSLHSSLALKCTQEWEFL